MKVLILSSQNGDWEGLFINEKLIDQGHVLGEGDSKLYMLKAGEKYGFTSKDVVFKETTDEDESYLEDCGSFDENCPKDFSIYQK